MDILYIFVLFMALQHLSLSTELTQFSKMIVNVQGQSVSLTTTNDIVPFVVGYLLLYSIIVIMLYYFIILKKETTTTAFLLGCALYTISDFTMYTLFEKARPYLATYLYDIFIVGGGSFALVTYLVQKHFPTVKQTILLPMIVYLYFIVKTYN